MAGGPTPQDNELHLRNNYTGLFVQDDWKIRHNLTVNLGLRWDYDSEFVNKRNFAPRLGVAWSMTPKTVVRGKFRCLLRSVPAGTGAKCSFVRRHGSKSGAAV